ncbi:Suppressor protein stp22 of temperature-sensitive alpha-factor receptor and arginine permease [Blastocladiella emersonii ATCC 22665]|nr:Suppressor protein stp22 of temperature-sensitive alpha-factor receptor and arginine permease [Blastocladiella emersonii ATCC 22665]
MDPQRQWLLQAARSYMQSDRVFGDADAALARYAGNVFPKLDTFVHPDGTSARLLCLYGTVPISFKQHTYNIPLEVWLPHMYPSIAPTVYVRPTATMCISPSKDVDANGKVFHACLHYWDMRGSDLVKMIAALQQAFSLDPPVYAKPPSVSANGTGASSATATSSNPANGRTPPPTRPKPGAMLSSSAGAQSLPPAPAPVSVAGGPPPPPSSHAAYPMGGGGFPMPTPPQTTTSPTNVFSMGAPSTLPPPMDPHAAKLANVRAQVVEQLAPKLAAFTAGVTAEMENLLHENKALYEAQVQLQAAHDAVGAEEKALAGNLAFVDKTLGDFAATVAAWRDRPEEGVDDVLVCTDPVQAQVLDAVAEDHAIEDTLYLLGKALDDGKVDPATYLKHVRSLAKEQFMHRALAKKCAKRLGVAS